MIQTSAEAVVRLRGVEKVYGTPDNPLTVLQGIDLEVAETEYVAIVGPSGAGKSTLLNILGCLDRPTRGSYYFMGENVASFDDYKLSQVRKTRMGFVFQSYQLISHLNVLENVEMPMSRPVISTRPRRRTS
jgi:ABC-type lipoprotein export system ATPase subunit